MFILYRVRLSVLRMLLAAIAQNKPLDFCDHILLCPFIELGENDIGSAADPPFQRDGRHEFFLGCVVSSLTLIDRLSPFLSMLLLSFQFRQHVQGNTLHKPLDIM